MLNTQKQNLKLQKLTKNFPRFPTFEIEDAMELTRKHQIKRRLTNPRRGTKEIKLEDHKDNPISQ